MPQLEIGQRIPLQNLTQAPVLVLEVQGAPGIKHHLWVKHETAASVAPQAAFAVAGQPGMHQLDLQKLPPQARITVVAEHPAGFKALGPLRLVLKAAGQPVAEALFPAQRFTSEQTVMLAEVYFKQGWRLAVLGQGFSTPMVQALQTQGGTLAPVLGLPAPPGTAGPASGGKLNLSKLTLEKQGASGTIELRKETPLHPININLRWSGQAKAGLGSWLGLRSSTPDLDLGCMVEMQNGDCLVIQALGGCFGNRHQHPFILLDKDDRSGQSADGENLTLYQPGAIKRLLVYAFIYDGAATFADVQARVTLTDQLGNDVQVPLNQPRAERFCALALIEKQGQHIRITKEERYFQGHQACDRHYRFGFRWTTGTKD